MRNYTDSIIEQVGHLSAVYLDLADELPASPASITLIETKRPTAAKATSSPATYQLKTIRHWLTLIRAQIAKIDFEQLILALDTVAERMARKPLRLVSIAQILHVALENTSSELIEGAYQAAKNTLFDDALAAQCVHQKSGMRRRRRLQL